MKRNLGLVVVGALLAVVLLGGVNKAAVFDGVVETTNGGYMFPDQTVQTTAAINSAGFQPRLFYLTDDTFIGGLALTACASGYHMAHIWEFRNLDALRYDDSAPGAFNPDGSPGYDLETGPPMGPEGWIRTGAVTTGAMSENNPLASCGKWTDSRPTVYGKITKFSFTTGEVIVHLGGTGTRTCDSFIQVWCVED
ncbi:MAG: hypothetical protein WBH85_11580 [Thermoanaerobaculia bacterium]